ncbi:MAG: sigma factor-like helix-turn-helix DNA-binding protein [Candidatus Taylorbacteria bacterium]
MNHGPYKSYRHQELSQALHELNMSCYKFSQLCGVTPGEMSDIMFRAAVPCRMNNGKNSRVRIRFQELSGYLWEELFPDDFAALREKFSSALSESKTKPRPATEMLRENGFIPNDPVTPFEEVAQSEESQSVNKVLDEVLSSLTIQQAAILRMRFMEGLTLEKCAEKYRVTRQRIGQIESKALRLMRHPTRIRKLQEVHDALS